MSRRFFPFFIIAAIFAVITIPAWSKSNSTNSISVTITLAEKANVNTTTLDPGEYKVVAEGNQAKFEKDGKVVAEVPCTLKTLSNKASQTEATVDHGQLKEVLASGKTEAIEFSSGQSSGN